MVRHASAAHGDSAGRRLARGMMNGRPSPPRQPRAGRVGPETEPDRWLAGATPRVDAGAELAVSWQSGDTGENHPPNITLLH
jgi:hypothetical protein